MKAQYVLTIVRLPLRIAFTDDDCVADRLDAKARQGDLRWDLRPKPAQGAQDFRRGEPRIDECCSRPQYDEILEREPIFTATTARRRHKARVDQPANDGTR